MFEQRPVQAKDNRKLESELPCVQRFAIISSEIGSRVRSLASQSFCARRIEYPASLKPVQQDSLRSLYSVWLRWSTGAATGGRSAQNSQRRTEDADDLGFAS